MPAGNRKAEKDKKAPLVDLRLLQENDVALPTTGEETKSSTRQHKAFFVNYPASQRVHQVINWHVCALLMHFLMADFVPRRVNYEFLLNYTRAWDFSISFKFLVVNALRGCRTHIVIGHYSFRVLSFTFQFWRKISPSRCCFLLSLQRDREIFLKI